MKRAIACAILAATLAVHADTAYWKSGGSGAFTDPSHWRNGKVPAADWQVRFDATKDAVVDDTAIGLFTNFNQVVLAGDSMLTLSNTVEFTICKDKAWFVSDGVLVKRGSGKLVLDHSVHENMINVYGGFEVRDGEVEFTTSGKQVLPQCPIGVFAPGKLRLPTGTVCKFIGLYGDGHVYNPQYDLGIQTFFIQGSKGVGSSRDNPAVFSGTFENSPFNFWGEATTTSWCYQQFTNPDTVIKNRLLHGYVGTATYPTGLIYRGVGEYEYLGSGESVSSTIMMNNAAHCMTFNGGPNGGLVLAGDLKLNSENTVGTETRNEYVGEIIFAGDHTTPCELTGIQSVSGARPAYWKKTGTGTWRFTGSKTRSNNGVVAVEKGAIEYDAMAERGSASPLGAAGTLLEEYYGAVVDLTRTVPYAYLLGDGTLAVSDTTATMKYIGSSAARITTRPVAIRGAGRFVAEGAALDWTDFTPAGAGSHTLVLGGAASGSVAHSVTNGAGTLSIVKEGAGDWTLQDDFDASGSVTVKGGTLNVADNHYQWYRLSLMENYNAYDYGDTGTPLGQRKDCDGNRIWLSGFALYDADNNNLIENLPANKSAFGNVSTLQPGEAAYDHTDYTDMAATYTLTNLFNDTDSVCGGNRAAYPQTLTNPNSWVKVVVRLRANSGIPVKYDLKSYGRKSWPAGFVRDVRSWKLEGSADGIAWNELHSVISNEANEVTATGNWYSSDTPTFTTGYGIDVEQPRPASFASVSVSGSGTFANAGTAISTDTIKYDGSVGGGTISGLALADSGTLDIVNVSFGVKTIPIALNDMTGLDNLALWQVRINGKTMAQKRASYNGSAIEIVSPGLLLFVK